MEHIRITKAGKHSQKRTRGHRTLRLFEESLNECERCITRMFSGKQFQLDLRS